MNQILRVSERKITPGETPLVSICCITYNHEKYISKCIEGFLAQVTSFPVEILIHDDASTDRTQAIIRSYAEQYPELILPVLQKENQYSRGFLPGHNNFNRSRGSFVALCHGDDYWLNELKLEDQISAMKKFDVGMCGHPAVMMNEDGSNLQRLTGLVVLNATHISQSQLIGRNGNVCPYGSIVLDKDALKAICRSMPPVRFHTGIQLLGSARNGLVQLPLPMSAYRINVPGSTSELLLGTERKALETAALRLSSFIAAMKLSPSSSVPAFNHAIGRQLAVLISSRHFDLVSKVLRGENAPGSIHFFIAFSALAKIALRSVRNFLKRCLEIS